MNYQHKKSQPAHPVIWFCLAFVLLCGAYLVAQLSEHDESARVRKVKPKEMYAKVIEPPHIPDEEEETLPAQRPEEVEFSEEDQAGLKQIIEES